MPRKLNRMEVHLEKHKPYFAREHWGFILEEQKKFIWSDESRFRCRSEGMHPYKPAGALLSSQGVISVGQVKVRQCYVSRKMPADDPNILNYRDFQTQSNSKMTVLSEFSRLKLWKTAWVIIFTDALSRPEPHWETLYWTRLHTEVQLSRHSYKILGGEIIYSGSQDFVTLHIIITDVVESISVVGDCVFNKLQYTQNN